MNRNVTLITIGLTLGVFISGALPAHGESTVLRFAQERTDGKATPAVKEVCPVSGEEIGKETNITYEYKGKTYKFCCPSCVEEFKKDPEKYIEKMKKKEKKNDSK